MSDETDAEDGRSSEAGETEDDDPDTLVSFDEDDETEREAAVEDGDEFGDAGPPVPLEGLASSVRRRSQSDGDASDASRSELADLFDHEPIEGIDTDAIWEQIQHEDVIDPEVPADREVRDVPKAAYCHTCEHFSRPPAVACTNEGTDILEVATLETFRVADCPLVLENEALEKE